MFKYSNIAIVLSFISLWLLSFISVSAQIIIGFVLIFSFGILHGANDILLMHRLNVKQTNHSAIKLLIYYVFVVLIGVLLFFLIPGVALTLFIVISGYHFGEQQWQYLDNIKTKWLPIIFKTIYGMFILFALFYFNMEEVQNIIFKITNHLISFQLIIYGLQMLMIFLLIAFVYLYLNLKNLRNQIVLEIFHLIVLSIIFMSSSLIWGFTIYFVIWHSLPSMADQIKFLYKDVNIKSCKAYFKSAFYYWIISLLGITTIYLIFSEEHIFNALFFSFLAAITFPHVLVIIKMFSINKSTSN